MIKLSLAILLLALGFVAVTPARADFAVIEFSSGYCRVWTDTAFGPEDGQYLCCRPCTLLDTKGTLNLPLVVFLPNEKPKAKGANCERHHPGGNGIAAQATEEPGGYGRHKPTPPSKPHCVPSSLRFYTLAKLVSAGRMIEGPR